MGWDEVDKKGREGVSGKVGGVWRDKVDKEGMEGVGRGYGGEGWRTEVD